MQVTTQEIAALEELLKQYKASHDIEAVPRTEVTNAGCGASCMGTCKGTCFRTCKGTCNTTCKGSCTNSCKGTCRNTCKGNCSGTAKKRR